MHIPWSGDHVRIYRLKFVMLGHAWSVVRLLARKPIWDLCRISSDITWSRSLWFRMEQNSNRPSETRPVGFFPFTQWKFSLAGTWWNFNFLRPVCGFPGATFTYPAYTICVCLKKAKERPERKGKPGRKSADPVTIFPITRWEYRCHLQRGVIHGIYLTKLLSMLV